MKHIIVFIVAFFVCSCGSSRSVYVSSSRGLDTNDGSSPKRPFKTIKAAAKNADTLFLAAGDVFYEYVVLRGKYMTRYGKGRNPEINGLRTITGRPWQKVKDNIWVADLTSLPSTGYIINGTSELNNVGCLYETDKDLLHGFKHHKYEELSKDWDFFQTDMPTYHKNGNKQFDKIYLYYTGNPNDLSLALSVGSHYGLKLYNSTVERVNVIGFGTGGINLFGSSNVRNCRVDLIGGSMQLHWEVTTCLGNGIDFWVNEDAYDCVIEDNYISRCYDCGGSIQAIGCDKATPRNIVYRNNLISHCCQGWEDFLTKEPHVKFENCRFENNYVVYAGDTGFGYPAIRRKYCNVLGNNMDGDKGMIIRNNVFVGGNYYCSGAFQEKYCSNVWSGNVHYVERGAYILSNYFGTKDVLRIPETGDAQSVIGQYRNLTSDNSTKFIISSKQKIDSLSKKTIRKYLKKHKY